jgi:glycosyltransferase involved in cell wall biosynthesis
MIFLLQRVSSHYREPVFEKLNSKLDGKLVVGYGKAAKNTYFPDGYNADISFKTVRFKNIWLGGERAVWQNFWQIFRQYGTPEAVISEHSPRILSLYPLFVYCRSRNIPLILWGHGGSRKRSISESRAMKDKIHRLLIRKANAYICYTDGIKEELVKITEPEKIFVARNTLDTERFGQIRTRLENLGKNSVKKKLGLAQSHYVCFIGRLLPSKRLDQVVEIYSILKKRMPDTGLIIIGDGPERNNLQHYIKENKKEDILLTGELSDWEKSAEYLYASDVIIIPQSAGLAINHAFSFGLPVITQSNPPCGPYHGPEIEYVIDGKTGFICDYGHLEQMASCAEKIIKEKAYFTNQVDVYCRQYLGLDAMIHGMVSAIDYSFK